jgi:hypothetical protein
MKKAKPTKPYWKMTRAELAEATKEFDREIPANKLRPLTKAERERWERATEQPSRSIYIMSSDDPDVEPVFVELDRELVRRMDACAKERKMSRTELIDRGIRAFLAFSEQLPPRGRSRKSA